MNNHDNCIDKAFELINELHEHIVENNAVVKRGINNKQYYNLELLTLLNRSSKDIANACGLILAAAENCLSDEYVFSMIVDPSNYDVHEDADEEGSPVDSEEPEQVCKIIDYSTKSVIT